MNVSCFILPVNNIAYHLHCPGCQDVDRDPLPGSPGYNMAIVAHLAYLIRYVDFADTLFFILRKKFANVSALQESILNTFTNLFQFCQQGVPSACAPVWLTRILSVSLSDQLCLG